jgi:hypothetical protein
MLKWFYRWLDSKIQNSRYEDDEHLSSGPVVSSKRLRKNSTVRDSEELSSEPIQFKMYKAIGGWAIEFRQYDNRNDRVDTSIYVINGEEELGHNISKIITMEALKR